MSTLRFIQPRSLRDLDQMDAALSQAIRRYSSLAWLAGVNEYSRNDDPRTFALADIAVRAVRDSSPERAGNIPVSEFHRALDFTVEFLTADPMTWPENIEAFHSDSAGPALYRLLESQFRYRRSSHMGLGRPLVLFGSEIAKRAAKKSPFESEKRLEETLGMPLSQFITFGLALNAFDRYSKGPFSKAATREIFRRFGASDEIQAAGFSRVVADRFALRQPQIGQASDRRFRMYDLNPLLRSPILLPYRESRSRPDMIAPVPDLVFSRFSAGIFYDMLAAWRMEFTNWFGYAFEAYCGWLIDSSVPTGRVVGEDELSKLVEKGQPVVDFLVRGENPTLIECKVGGAAVAASQGSAEAEKQAMKKVVEGVKQLSAFRRIVMSQPSRFHYSKEVSPVTVLVTYHDPHLFDSEIGRAWVRSRVQGDVEFPDLIVGVTWLEEAQSTLFRGLDLSELVRVHSVQGPNAAAALVKTFGARGEESVLLQAQKKLLP